MIGFLNSWASGVVVSVIVGSIIEMILPEGNNKKYVKTVIGVFILFTIISPVIVQFSGGIDLKSIVNFEEYSNTITASSSNVNLVNDNDVLKVYENNIAEQITNTLKQNGYNVNQIKVIANKNENNYGEIIEVNLNVQKGISNIEKIYININNDTHSESNLSAIEENKIKELIQLNYGISKENIKFK